MAIYILKLINRYFSAKNTVVFVFEKPKGFNFKPGQYGGFTLLHADKNIGGLTRRFSLLSAPQDDHLAIATRLQNSPYKQNLNQLAINDEIKFAGPTGKFTLPDDESTPIVLIAGGIGITPFYCMIKDATHRKSTQQLTLFYGNQTLEDAAFLNELTQLQKLNPHFTLIAALAHPKPDWQGEKGWITDRLINKYISDLNQNFYYICGAPAMVTAVQEMLAELGIDEDRIQVEDFPGY